MGCTLVIDTSFGSTVGIVGREPIVETDSRTHVEKLQVNIARAVEEAGLTPADIEEIVVGIGPAPFPSSSTSSRSPASWPPRRWPSPPGPSSSDRTYSTRKAR